MSSPRRLAAAALFLLATSAFAVPACEVDSSSHSHGGTHVAQRPTPPVDPIGHPVG
jgi:hypothetical protein